MDTRDQALERFLRHWTIHFGRSLQVFTGEKPTLTVNKAQSESPAAVHQSQEYLWWTRVVEGQPSSAISIGAKTETWSALGGTNSAATDESKQSYFEMLTQALEGAVSDLNAEVPNPLRFGPGEEQAPANLSSLTVADMNVGIRGNSLPALAVALSPELLTMLRVPSEPETIPTEAFNRSQAEDKPLPTMLERLMDLELPLSVALGRASLPIAEILKMTSGSLIELDRDVGEYVELTVHGTVVARGEVVSVKGNYGVRIKEIMSRNERIALHRGLSKKAR